MNKDIELDYLLEAIKKEARKPINPEIKKKRNEVTQRATMLSYAQLREHLGTAIDKEDMNEVNLMLDSIQFQHRLIKLMQRLGARRFFKILHQTEDIIRNNEDKKN